MRQRLAGLASKGAGKPGKSGRLALAGGFGVPDSLLSSPPGGGDPLRRLRAAQIRGQGFWRTIQLKCYS
jgi:hypothetical protein